MKKILLVIVSMALCFGAEAAFVRNMPVKRLQPNGDTLHCFVTGDEFYHRLHDAEGYTIVQNHRTGWYVYADREWNAEHSDWTVVATNYIVGSVEPASVGISRNIIASPETVREMHKSWEVIDARGGTQAPVKLGTGAPAKMLTSTNRGTINNIVIFIRFADEGEISTPYSTIEAMFNDSSANAVSMHNYFWRASYSQLRIPTYFYPTPDSNSVVSYQDIYSRNYYMPYDATTNSNGYYDDDQRRNREFGLLERAVNYINSNYSIPTDLNIDMDNDGYVDNICFIVKGTYTGWNDLLWPHKWSLYDRNVYINGKRVYTFNLQLEGSGSHYFSTSTFCHEMFHTLGAPDLYRYYNYTNVSSVGSWDLMCSNTTPPQHMGMYMKMQYGKWIDTIPEITEAGTYTLNSVGDSIHTNNQCYRIKASDPSQWYMLEYRDNTELFETGLGGRGLLIYRIDSRYPGSASFDRQQYFDEVYIFRPGGYNDTTNGNLAQAFFSANSGRTAFSASTDPSPWLTGNVQDTTIEISNVSAVGNTISFTYTPHRPVLPDCGDSACTVTVEMRDSHGDTWNGAYLAFENMEGEVLATFTMGDGMERETQSVNLCRQPIAVKWHPGVSAHECGYKIILADSSVWKNTGSAGNTVDLGTILDPCERYIPQQYNIIVQSNMGDDDSINYLFGSGTYEEGTTHYILAQPGEHYSFMGWHDGPYNGPEDNDVIHSTEQRRYYKVMCDSLFTAIFKPTYFTVRVIPATGHESFGTVTGSDTVTYGTSVTVSAEPAEGYAFDYWRKNYSSTLLYDNPLTDVVTANVTYRAFFRALEGIGETEDNVNVYTVGKELIIEGAEGCDFEVVNAVGVSVMRGKVLTEASRHILPGKGLYIVRIAGEKAVKVLAK